MMGYCPTKNTINTHTPTFFLFFRKKNVPSSSFPLFSFSLPLVQLSNINPRSITHLFPRLTTSYWMLYLFW